MKENFVVNLSVRFILILLAAIPTNLFYNSIIAWNFNFPQFSYWEIVLGLVSGWFIRIAVSRFPDNEK